MSEIRVNTLSNEAGTGPVTLTKQSAAKVWANFNGVTFGARESFGVSSFTDNGTGDYSLSLTSSMANTNYSITSSGTNELGIVASTAVSGFNTKPVSVSSIALGCNNGSGNSVDPVYYMLAINGDLA